MSGRISAVVVRLIVAGLRQYSPGALPADDSVDALLAGGDDSVALEPYRELLETVRQRAGGKSLLRAGRTLDDLADPLLFVLLNSDSVAVLIEKEARLGRFIHSRHVVRIVEQRDRGVLLEHHSREAEPPRATEHLAAAGQHVALLEQVGCQGLVLALPDSEAPRRRVYEAGAYHEPADGSYRLWDFSWQAFTPTRRPMPGLDEMLLASDARGELVERERVVAAVERVARADLGRTWTVADVAARLDTSPRSLQRSLSAEGARFSDVLDQLRVAEAQRLLRHSELSVTEIGYVCGFADTSHFSRRFKQRVGSSPSAYRGAA
ncbi:MAG: helix-turn-helix transcriptional regulator [Myxococcales bacterium]|nr:helix-turn-helix transcriptional regulator [Myxococcales bacterium]